MANTFIKSTVVANQMLGVLERDVVLPKLVWREGWSNFKGAYNDTISLRVPAYMNARTRTMRSGAAITIDELDETKVDVQLNKHIYRATAITDEELTLDINDFGSQVTAPSMSAVVRGIENALVTTMAGAPYVNTAAFDLADLYPAIVNARVTLSRMNVPLSDRFLAVGSEVERRILSSDRFSKFDSSGSTEALREASMGRIAGFDVISVPGLDPDWAIAAHKTAFVLALQAPVLPTGATWGTTANYNGFAIRVLRDYDVANVRDRLLTDVFMGSNYVADRGVVDGDGKWQPGTEGDEPQRLIRAVKLILPGAS